MSRVLVHSGVIGPKELNLFEYVRDTIYTCYVSWGLSLIILSNKRFIVEYAPTGRSIEYSATDHHMEIACANHTDTWYGLYPINGAQYDLADNINWLHANN